MSAVATSATTFYFVFLNLIQKTKKIKMRRMLIFDYSIEERGIVKIPRSSFGSEIIILNFQSCTLNCALLALIFANNSLQKVLFSIFCYT